MTDYLARNTVHVGDVRELAARLEPASVQTIITSPPYYNLRDYGTATWEGGDDPACDHALRRPETVAKQVASSGLEGGKKTTGFQAQGHASVCGRCGAARVDKQLGLEATPAEFVANLVAVFAALRPALKDDGTLWCNLGDGYANDAKWGGTTGGKHAAGVHGATGIGRAKVATGYPPKCLLGMPWRVAFALIDDGWILRAEIIWHKPNPMPESVTDRPTRAHEQIFLFAKRPTYFYDAEAIKESVTGGAHARGNGVTPKSAPAGGLIKANANYHGMINGLVSSRNKRSVWTVPSAQFPGSHYATFPPDLIRPCVLAGTSEKGECASCGRAWARVVDRESAALVAPARIRNVGGRSDGYTQLPAGGVIGGRSVTTGWAPQCACDAPTRPQTVLDPFMGSGTTALVAHQEGRDWLGLDLDERAVGWTNERLRALPVARLAGM